MKLLMLRHGKTQGNLEKRYIGTTDEPLSDIGYMELKRLANHNILKAIGLRSSCIYTSPLVRCIQTARTLFPDINIRTIEAFKEMDFGDFEGKNYLELSDNVQYQEWIDSNGTLPFPNGEAREEFQNRCCNGFLFVCNEIFKKTDTTMDAVIMVVHGGTIMSIMDRYERSTRTYYDYQIGNGDGYICDLEYDCASKKVSIAIQDLVTVSK